MEKVKKDKQGEVAFPSEHKKQREFKPVQHVVYKLLKKVGLSHMEYVQKRDTAYYTDEKGERKQRTMRYHSQATSIFLDEQKGLGEDDSKIAFIAGDLIVEPENVLLIKYLDMRNDNKSNPNRKTSVQPMFYKFDPIKKAEDEMKAIETKDDAIFAYKQIAGDLEEVIAIARRIKKFSKDMNPAQVKFAVRMFAYDNPEKFIAVKDDPATRILSILEDAVELQIIEVGRQVIRWKDGENILEFSLGKNPLERMTDWILGGEGNAAYEEIRKQVEKILY